MALADPASCCTPRPPDGEAIDALPRRAQLPARRGHATSPSSTAATADAVQLRHFIYGLPSSQPFTARRRHRPLVPHRRAAAAARASSTSSRSSRGDERALDPRPAQPAPRARPVRRQLGLPRRRLRDAGLDAAPTPRRGPGALESVEVPTRAFGGERDGARSTCRRACGRRRRYPLLVVHDGERLPALRGHEDRARQPDPPPRDPAAGRGAHAVAATACASTPATPTHARFVAEELRARARDAASRCAQRRPARGLLGASFGAVAALSTAWRHPGLFGRLLLQSGSFAFTDIGERERGPAFEPGRRVRQRLPRRARQPVPSASSSPAASTSR